MVGVARWVNHSCRPNCDYYMSGGFNGRPCVRLRALQEIPDGSQLMAFYSSNYFGEDNVDCLCGHNDLHGLKVNDVETDTLCCSQISESKKRRRVLPRIKFQERSTVLEGFINFYDECSNLSTTSLESSLEINFPVNIGEQIPGIVVSEPEFEQLSDIDVCDTDLFESEVDASAALIRNSSSSSGSSKKYSFNFNQRSSQPLNDVNDVFPVNLAASLVALLAKHNGSDALLNDLLKRDQALFGDSALTPWSVRSQFQEVCQQYQSSKKVSPNGELILLNFRSLLMDIVIKSLPDMLLYARSKDVNEDILLPELKITDGKLSIRLLVNTDGAVVSKSPVLSAWPLFLAIADLPPRKRQAFENIMLVSLFVGSGYPNFDCIFAHIKKELSVSEYIDFEGQKLAVSFKPILLIADLIAKAKVLKMKQCNGYYGCTLCTQRGTHYAGAHQYPHDQPIVMRSADSHLINIRELESRSIEKMKSKHGPENDCEMPTQGVKGRSKILSLIPNQPLSSPVDPMHQLFLGVSKELFLFFYDKMHSAEKRELNEFISSLKLPHEFKNSVRSLDPLHTFKAIELKFVLFYLSPVAFPPFFHGEDRVSDEIDLKKLVFATRSLFDTIANADFCDRLLNEFCRSMAEKNGENGINKLPSLKALGMAGQEYRTSVHHIGLNV